MVIVLLSFFLMTQPPPISTLFPYTTLFRSGVLRLERDRRGVLKIFPTVQAAEPTAAEPAPGMEGADLQAPDRSEEHTSELQSRVDLVCRLLLEKKNNMTDESTQHVDMAAVRLIACRIWRRDGHCPPLFFSNDTAPPDLYTLSLHDALPIWCAPPGARSPWSAQDFSNRPGGGTHSGGAGPGYGRCGFAGPGQIGRAHV